SLDVDLDQLCLRQPGKDVDRFDFDRPPFVGCRDMGCPELAWQERHASALRRGARLDEAPAVSSTVRRHGAGMDSCVAWIGFQGDDSCLREASENAGAEQADVGPEVQHSKVVAL